MKAASDDITDQDLQRFGEVRAVAGARAHFVVGPDGAVRAVLHLRDGAPAMGAGRCSASSGGESIALFSRDDLDCAAHLAALLD